jgi:hypothetical protein
LALPTLHLYSYLEIEFGKHAKIVGTIETIRQAINDDMSIDQIAKALTGTKNAIDLVGKIGDLATRTVALDLQENIITLRGDLINVKESLFEIREEKLSLEEKILTLEKQNKELKTPSVSITKKGKFHYKNDEDDPICPNCYERNRKIIILSNAANISFRCPDCKFSLDAVS